MKKIEEILDRMGGPDVLALYRARPDMIESVVRYAVDGAPEPGGFLCALLANDFLGAVGRADSDNVRHLRGWAVFITSALPVGMLRYGDEPNHVTWARERRAINPAERLDRTTYFLRELYPALFGVADG